MTTQHLPRIDFIFSYWIFAWFICYATHLTQYNPKIFLIGAIAENMIYLSLMLYYHNSLIYILLFLFINFIIKVLPLWWVWNSEYTMPDFYAGIILFVIYICWLYANNVITNENSIYNKMLSTINNIKQNKPSNATPLTFYFAKYLGYDYKIKN